MNEDTGLESGATHDDLADHNSVEALQEQARAAVQAVRCALEALARAGGRPLPQESVLPELWRERDLALRALGLAVLDCELVDAAPVEAPTEEEVPTETMEVAPAEPVAPPLAHAPPAVPPSPPAADAVRRLSQHFAGAAPPAPAPVVPQAPPPWVALADAELPARPLDMAGAVRELRVLEQELERLKRRSGGPRALHGLAVDCIVARARVLQQEWSQPPVEKGLSNLFSSLTRFVTEAGLPYVVGLKREHEPPAGTWRAEVETRTARLCGALDVGSLAARSASAARPVRPSKKTSASDAGAALPQVPSAVLARTQGQRGLVVGGDNRGAAGTRIREVLGLASLDWESGKKMRRVRSTAGRLRNGRYGVVIVLQSFISHKVTQTVLPSLPAGDEVVCAFVPRGYGVEAVVRAVVETVDGSEGREE